LNHGHSSAARADCLCGSIAPVSLVLAGSLTGHGGFALKQRILGFGEVAPQPSNLSTLTLDTW
jgi:hypothetical protein